MMRLQKAANEAKPEVEKFVVRLPNGMRQEIADVARRSRRSMNAEIVTRLERSLLENDHVEIADKELSTATTQPLRVAADSSSQTNGEEEQRLLQAFRNLNIRKREAILQLLA
jgi:hypothetical protein